MDAGPSHTPRQLLSSESEEYSDADSDFEEDYAVDGTPQDGVFVEARAAASDYSDEYEDEVRDKKGKGKETGNGTARHKNMHEHSTEKVKRKPENESRSWSDLDVSIIIALLSPVGNWLTGGDHVKNLFLLVLLIFYLHQLTEVPWQLYKGSRTRVSPRQAQKLEHAADPTSAAAKLALSELHTLELLYLSCTVIAPFLGAMLVRYVFSAMNGVDSLSWFSTTLFILATGLRPWSHLVSRLRERTSELQDVVYQPARDEKDHEYELRLKDMISRVEVLERLITELRAKASRIGPLQEACDDLGEALGDMERCVLRHERKVDAARVAHGSRLSAVERNISRLEESQRKQLAATPPEGVARLYIPIHPRLAQAISRILELPQKLHDKALLYLASNLPQQRALQQSSKLDTTSPTITPSHTHTESLHYFNGTPLETIPEADDSDSDGTYVSEKGTSPTTMSPILDRDKKRSIRIKSRSRSRSRSNSHPSVHRPRSLSRKAFDWVAAIVSWPYRSAMKILLFVVPSPIQKLFV